MDGPGQHRQDSPGASGDSGGRGGPGGAASVPGARLPPRGNGAVPGPGARRGPVRPGPQPAAAGGPGAGENRGPDRRDPGRRGQAAAHAPVPPGGAAPADRLRPAQPEGPLPPRAGGSVRGADRQPGAAGGPGGRVPPAGGDERGEGAGPGPHLHRLPLPAVPGGGGPAGPDGEAGGAAGGVKVLRRKGCIPGWLYILYRPGDEAHRDPAAHGPVRHRHPAGGRQRSGDLRAERPGPGQAGPSGGGLRLRLGSGGAVPPGAGDRPGAPDGLLFRPLPPVRGGLRGRGAVPGGEHVRGDGVRGGPDTGAGPVRGLPLPGRRRGGPEPGRVRGHH